MQYCLWGLSGQRVPWPESRSASKDEPKAAVMHKSNVPGPGELEAAFVSQSWWNQCRVPMLEIDSLPLQPLGGLCSSFSWDRPSLVVSPQTREDAGVSEGPQDVEVASTSRVGGVGKQRRPLCNPAYTAQQTGKGGSLWGGQGWGYNLKTII